MPIQLHFSNHSEVLVQQLHQALQAQWRNPFEFPPLIVQNQLVEKWLKLQWTESRGVVANYRALLIESWLWQLLATPEHERLGADHLELAVLQVLQDSENLPRELQQYLDVGNDTSKSRRRVQLAQRMARLFLEYQSNRPLIIENEKITHRGFGFDPEAFSQGLKNQERKAKMQVYEKWQEELYLKARQKLTEIYGEKLYTLPELWLQHWDSLRDLPTVQALQGQTIHLFGISGLSLFHRHCLIQLAHGGKLGANLNIEVYLLNPCADFWEDVKTPQEQRFNQRQCPGQTYFHQSWAQIASHEPGELWQDTGDNALLQQWGQAGRDNIALWCQAADYNIDENYATSSGTTLLGAVQDSLLERQNSLDTSNLPAAVLHSDIAEGNAPAQDSSLRIIGVPGMAREVEVLRERILYLLAQDPQLKLHQIGVFCPKPAEYRPYFAQIFDVTPSGSPYHIPYEFTEENGGASAFAQGLNALFTLGQQEWKRSQVFAFLRNPVVQATRNFSAETQIEWETWAHQLNIFNSWNSHEQSWERGIQRLLVSDLTDSTTSLRPGNLPEDWLVPWENFASADEDNRWEFISNLELLQQQLAHLRTDFTQTYAEWSHFTENLVQTWLNIPFNANIANLTAEKSVQNMFMRQLQAMARYAGTCNWEEWRLLCTNRLDAELPLRSSVLSGKLMVSTLREARPLPWKHAFVLGMHSGEFPPPQSEDRLDLRWWKPIPGDNNPRRAMQYAFLELLVCVRQSLTLSYQCEDLAKIAPINPSSTLIELQRFLAGQNQPHLADIAQIAALHNFESSEHLVEFPRVKNIVELMRQLQASKSVSEDEKGLPDEVVLAETTTTTLTDPAEPSAAAKVAGDTNDVKDTEACQETLASAVTAEFNVADDFEQIPPADGPPLSFKQLKVFLENPLEYTITQNLELYSDNSKDLSQNDDALLQFTGLETWDFLKIWQEQMVNHILMQPTLPYYEFGKIQELAKTYFNITLSTTIASGRAVEHILRPDSQAALQELIFNVAFTFSQLCESYAGYQIETDYKCHCDNQFIKDHTKAFYRLYKDKGDEIFLYITPSSDSRLKNYLEMYLFSIWRAINGEENTQFYAMFNFTKTGDTHINFNMSKEEALAIVDHCHRYAHSSEHNRDYLPISDINIAKPSRSLAPNEDYKPNPLHVLLNPELNYPTNHIIFIRKRLQKLFERDTMTTASFANK